jgi:quinol-cytochrome oxidoreductase complex cytochrome b subunit
MTSSQLLNSQGVPVVPFYKRKALISVVLAFFLLILGQFFMADSEKPTKKKMTK